MDVRTFITNEHDSDQLQEILTKLPVKKQTMLFIASQLSKATVTQDHAGVEIAKAAMIAVMYEKENKKVIDLSAEFLKDGLRLTATEGGFVPVMLDILLPHIGITLWTLISLVLSFFHGGWIIWMLAGLLFMIASACFGWRKMHQWRLTHQKHMRTPNILPIEE